MPHPHKFEIADKDAILCLIDKLEKHAHKNGEQNERLRKAVSWAEKQAVAVEPSEAGEREIAFYHGLLTGYAVALNLH
jgi:hypothetical protein